MFLVYHGDHEDMLFSEPVFYDTRDEAIASAEKRVAADLPAGHRITVYECRETRTLVAGAAASQSAS